MENQTGRQRAHDNHVSKAPICRFDFLATGTSETAQSSFQRRNHLLVLFLLGIFASFPESFLSTFKTMAVAELFLAAFLQVLFDRLASREVLNFLGRYVGLGKKLDKWKGKLERIQAVVDDADKKQDKVEAVKQWLNNVRDLAYDVDDILDDFAMEVLLTSKVRKLIPARYSPLTNIRLGSKIKIITGRINDILKEKDELRLKDGVAWRTNEKISPCMVHEDRVFGREKDKKAILELLLSETYNNDAEVSVISINGMGGVGKTTLASLVFHDTKVESHFDVKAWAYVSDDFNVLSITRTIFDFVINQTREDKDTQTSTYIQSSSTTDLVLLQGELKKQLRGKKFLVILDDVWTRDYGDWDKLRAPFLKGTPESRIVITTRDREVSSMMMGPVTTVPALPLQVLSDDECISVLTRHVLGEGKSFNTAAPSLKNIGEKIGRKCKGLPLAAINFAGLLRSKLDPQKWEEVSNRGIFLPTLPTLILSYQDLPSHIKRCFAYCSILPKGYEFEEKQLVLLWMAEGLIQPQEGERQMEDLGSEYFQELVKKSLFQKSSKDESRFMMHDFINDLALWVARGTCFRMDDRFEDSNEQKNLKKARHLSYLCSHGNCRNNFEALSELKRLRTFLPLVLPNQGGYSLTCNNVSPQLLSKLRRIRVLSLSGYHITELPKSIGDLKHLRYLDLSNTSIESMPKSTTTLYNLQTLILDNCFALKKLPSKFRKLVNLRHLNIRKTCLLEGMPPQMDKLTCLQTLSNFVVGKGPCSRLKELGPLSHLRETLYISRLENVLQLGDATDANLIRKVNLGGLLLEWSCNLDNLQNRTLDTEVLNELRPHEYLKELTIKCYDGIEFPIWLRTPSFPNMVLLRLENCKKCTSLPPVGQLSSLKVLSIIGMDGVQEIGAEFYEGGGSRPFESLETLCFKNMEKWENWIPCGEFPHLLELSIQSCPKLLGKLPSHFPLLKRVVIKECRQLVVSSSSFPELCEQEIA